MDSSDTEAGTRQRFTSSRLPSDELQPLVNSRPRHVRFSKKGPNAFNQSNLSDTTQLPSHYHDLRQLEPEGDDLIQFDSRPLMTHTQLNRLDTSVGSPSIDVLRGGQPQQ